MTRNLAILAAALGAGLALAPTRPARADRLGGNYRGPDDVYVSRDDPPPAPPPPPPEKKPDEPTPPAGEEGGSDAKPASSGGGKPPSEPGGGSAPPEGGGEGHGGYRAPSGEVVTDGGSRSSEDPPSGAPEGGNAGGSGGPGSDAGTSSEGGAAAPTAGGSGKLGKGAAHDDRDRIWPFYFEAAKEEYFAAALGRRAEPRLSPPGTSTWMLSLQPEPSSRRRPVLGSDRDRAFGLVLGRFRDPDSRVRDAAAIALGKSARAEAVPFLRMAAERDADPAIREDACLALGLSGDRDEALPFLLARLAPPPAGAREKRIAFAALGLGLLGDASAAGPLRTVLEGAAFDPARAEDAACAATALGMLGDGTALPLFAKVLEARDAPDAVKCHVLHAVGRLGGHPSRDVRRDALEVLRPCLDRDPEIRQAAFLALGSFADATLVAPLLGRGILDPDSPCRNFAAQSLGRIAGRAGAGTPGYAAAARELGRYADSDRRDRWLFQSGNLALASMSCADREKDLLRLAEEMRSLNLHSASSVVLSLGVLGTGSDASSRELRGAYESRSAGGDVQAYAGLAMAMADAPGTAAALAKALTSASPADPAVARTTALALGLIGGAAEADLLVDVLRGKAGGERKGGDRMFLLGAAVQGLGIIGDGDSVEKLEPLLSAAEPWATRAFATAALGYLLEEDPARRISPRISEIFRHRNFRVSLPLVKAVEGTL